MNWQSINKDIQHLIIWKYVCNTQPLNCNKACIIDTQSLFNVYLAHNSFHVLSETEKRLIETRYEFHKKNIFRYWNGVGTIFTLEKAYEYLMRSYISYKTKKEYQGGVKLFEMYIYTKSYDNSCYNLYEYRRPEYPTLKYMALECCKYGMGQLFKYLVNCYSLHFKLSQKDLEWCIDFFMECGDINAVSWMHKEYDMSPSISSMDEAFSSCNIDIIRFCINRFNYSVSKECILDCFKMNNHLKIIDECLESRLIKIENIHFSNEYIYELFSYGCVESIKWGIHNGKIQKDKLASIFKYFRNHWNDSQFSLYEQSLITLKVIDDNL